MEVRDGSAGDDGRRFVVVSGLPGSGKTTLGRGVATALGLAFLDKDDELDRLLAAEGDPVDPATRTALSRRADAWLERVARSADGGAVIVSFWRRYEVSATAGTPTGWLVDLGDFDEVHCVCPPRVAADRFASRVRHPGHGDALVSTDELVRRFEALAALGPLALGRRAVLVDTERWPDVAAVVVALTS